MKKLISLLISVVFMLNFTAYADDTAKYHEVTHNLSINGNVGTSYAGENAFIVLVDNSIEASVVADNTDKIHYIDTCVVDEDGNFSGKVKLDNQTLENSKVYIRCGNYSSEITSFENTSITDIMNVSFDLNDGLFNFSNDSTATAKMHIDNVFGDISSCMMSVGFYDSNNLLIKVATDSSKDCGFTATDNLITINDIPQNASYAKIFAWNGMKSLDSAQTINKEKAPVDLFLVGDSTCYHYVDGQSNGEIQQGWGLYMPEYFDSAVTVHNYALCGASAWSYKTQTNNGYCWDRTLAEMKAGDYVIIALSINDNAVATADPIETYKSYTQGFIDDAKAKGVNVILMTEQNTQYDRYNELREITRAVKELAAKNDLVCLDINKMSNEHFDKMGFENTKSAYYLSEAASIRLNATQSFHEDLIHLNLDGARLISEFVAESIIESNSPLRAYVNDKQRTKLNDTPATYGL